MIPPALLRFPVADVAGEVAVSDEDLPNPHLPQQGDANTAYGAVQRIREIDQRRAELQAQLAPLQAATRAAIEQGDAPRLLELAEQQRPLRDELSALEEERPGLEREVLAALDAKGNRLLATYQDRLRALDSRQAALLVRLLGALEEAAAALHELDELPHQATAAFDAASRAWIATAREYEPVAASGPFLPPPRLSEVNWRPIGEALRQVADHRALAGYIVGAIALPDDVMDFWRERQLAERARPRVQ